MIHFDINGEEMQAIAAEFRASERQINMAISRALSRTAGTMRRRTQQAVAKGLDLRRANTLRRRLRALRLRRRGSAQEIALWVGMNDMRITNLKGSPSQGSQGASFRGVSYPGSFVARGRGGRLSIFKRRASGRLPLIEQTYPITDQVQVALEDEVFADIPDVFMSNFRADLRARTVFGVG